MRVTSHLRTIACLAALLLTVAGCSKQDPEADVIDWRTTLENTVTLPDGTELRVLTSDQNRLDMQIGELLQEVTGRVEITKQVPGVGSIQVEIDYKDGQRDGEEVVYAVAPFGDRKLISRASNRTGQREGEYVGYYPDLKVQCRIQFSKDRKNGLEEVFYPDGKPFLINTYKDGVFHGELKAFDATGTCVISGTCVDGKPMEGTLIEDMQGFVEAVFAHSGQKIQIPVGRFSDGKREESLTVEFEVPVFPSAGPSPGASPAPAGVPHGDSSAPHAEEGSSAGG